MRLSPIIFIGFTTGLGALLGSWLIGLVVGLGLVFAATCIEMSR